MKTFNFSNECTNHMKDGMSTLPRFMSQNANNTKNTFYLFFENGFWVYPILQENGVMFLSFCPEVAFSWSHQQKASPKLGKTIKA
jgi:hypothetical protein